MIERKTPLGVYYCRLLHEEHISPDCPRTIGNKIADDYVWEKVCRVINDPELLMAKARQMVDQLSGNCQALQDNLDRIQKELDATGFRTAMGDNPGAQRGNIPNQYGLSIRFVDFAGIEFKG